MLILILVWSALGFAISVLMGAYRLPKMLVGVLSLLAPALFCIAEFPESANANDTAALIIWGGLLVLFVAPVAVIAGLAGARIGNTIADKVRPQSKAGTNKKDAGSGSP